MYIQGLDETTGHAVNEVVFSISAGMEKNPCIFGPADAQVTCWTVKEDLEMTVMCSVHCQW